MRLALKYLFLLIPLLHACMKDEDFSTSPSDALVFSTDTVSFDTVMSGVPANTRTFMVYNPHDKGIRISSVTLEKGAASAFRVNVDGTFLAGGSAGDFEVLSKDSIRVFVEMTAPEGDSDEPVCTMDKLSFYTEGGASGSVMLRAFGQDVIKLHALVLQKDSTFAAKRPYQVLDSLVVAAGKTLTLEAGTRLYFHPNASLIVHGTLIAKGQLGNEVMLRGDRLGNMFSKQPYDRIPGQWGGVVFTAESFGNHLNYTDIHSGTLGLRCEAGDESMEKLRVENSVIRNMQKDAVCLEACNTFFGNSEIANAGGNCLTIVGGTHHFVHCTVAQFYVFTGGRINALNFANHKDNAGVPLNALNFENCILTGYAEDEIIGNRWSDESVPFNYRFENCLLCTPAYESENVVNCLWDTNEQTPHREGNFPPFDTANLLFSFSLNWDSRAIGNAGIAITEASYPLDRLGHDRLSDGKSDMGAYERQ